MESSCTQGDYLVAAPDPGDSCAQSGRAWVGDNGEAASSGTLTCAVPSPPPPPPLPAADGAGGIVHCSMLVCHQDGQEVAYAPTGSCAPGKSWTDIGSDSTSTSYACKLGPGY